VDRRYQVFVSSTYTDLIEERAAVISILLDLDAFPAGMELFPATNDDAWTLIQQVIDESDYYLLVIGGRYGSTDTASAVSYTEKEFDYAREQDKPVMAFLHGDPGKIAVENTDQDEASRKRLESFRAKVEDQVHVKYYTGADGLQGQVAASFQKLQKSHPAVGWVRGNVQTSSESLQELNALRKALDHAEQQLNAARESPPPGTDKFASGTELLTAGGTMEMLIASDNFPDNTYRYRCEATASWDSLFAQVGPAMMDEAKDSVLRGRVNAWYALEAHDDALLHAEEHIIEDAKGLDGDQPWHNPVAIPQDGEILDDGYETIIVQLRALGLITKSERKRGINDTATYWTLTPYGDTHLTTLRAIVREPESDGPQGPGPERDEAATEAPSG
jgi:Domain of unknown function (DUF4062)